MTRKPLLTLHEHDEAGHAPLQQRLYEVIYLADTPAGKGFDLALIAAILSSVLVMMLATVDALEQRWGSVFTAFEWLITGLFTIEYGLRIYCVRNRPRYLFSFFGIVDLLSILPFYLSWFFAGLEFALVIRALRVLRIFRILKMLRYIEEAGVLLRALRDSRQKIIIFYVFVLVLVTIFGSVIYVVEGPANGFTSIPISIYWAIVTVTTTGYGDMTPQTVVGQFIASLVMVTGYAVIAVPTGIFTAEMFRNVKQQRDTRQCTACGELGHEPMARHCHHCGARLA